MLSDGKVSIPIGSTPGNNSFINVPRLVVGFVFSKWIFHILPSGDSIPNLDLLVVIVAPSNGFSEMRI